MSKYLLGIDIGTTNVKAALYHTNFVKVSEGSSEYFTYFPSTGWAEQNADHWWNATVDALKQITASSTVNPKDIEAICVSSQAPALLPVDCDGKPLRNALIWMDRRSENQCDYLKKRIGQDRIVSITGNRIDPYFTLPKLLWYKENEPHLFGNTYKILQVNGYINFKLTGRYTTDKVHASLTGLFDADSQSWSAELCEKLGITGELLPEVFESTEVIGTVDKQAAKVTGLVEGIPVIAGNVDASSSAIESGVIEAGEAVEMTGTSTVLMIGCDQRYKSINLVSMSHAVKNHSLLIGPISSTGASLKWYRDQLGYAERNAAKELKLDPYKLMDMQAEQARPGSNNLLFIPYMAGERAPIWDTYARGVFFGLTLGTTRSQMIRAILEGSAFALYHNIIEAEKAGLKLEKLRAVGGGSESKLWLKIKASVINKPIVTLENSSSGTFGNTLLAGFGIGIYKNIGDIVSENIRFKDTFEPDADLHRHYAKLFKVYRNLYEHTREDMFILSNIQPEV